MFVTGAEPYRYIKQTYSFVNKQDITVLSGYAVFCECPSPVSGLELGFDWQLGMSAEPGGPGGILSGSPDRGSGRWINGRVQNY